ncbi:MAG TPA: hypothetical protein DEO73_17750 [Pantoea sp.]|uniref:Uncharacterized protein n=1 Tax=Candidatus Pantoea floridensis TaxID=1938870 RepID=A0A286BVY8_9GAMM|nr:hypothetical protein BX596_0128 [Enterobacteriaceae bacterium JKS000233]SOD38288.1 hypothetical protein SAMN06273570_2687 [Pantoea floridensis]HBZ17588.1 hypothetical protein [Pantoea sp.]
MRATRIVAGQDAKDSCHDDKRWIAQEKLSWMSREHCGGWNAANENREHCNNSAPFFYAFFAHRATDDMLAAQFFSGGGACRRK